jgi:DNA-binding MarR family transcriptional regulator
MKKREEGQPEVLNRKIKGLAGLYHGVYSGAAVSDNEFWVWYTLVAMEGDHTQQDICAMWSLPKQTVNTAIAHMRLRRYAILEAVPRTRNRKIIRLTAEGRRFGEKVVEPIVRAEERALCRVEPEEMATVSRIFGKYINIIREEMLCEREVTVL